MMRENESDSGHGWPGPWDYVQHGNLDPWYDRDQDEAGDGGDGGRDSGPPPRRARRGGHLLVYLTAAALAAGLGAGLTVAFAGQGASSSAGVSSGDIPSPHDNAADSGVASGLNPAAVERKVKPGLVDITSTLTYSSETA